jgi:F-type H+-transporting ATPase subunit delta
MALALANRYARALADLVLDAKSTLKPEEALAGLRQFEETFAASNDLRNILLNPAVTPARKRAVVAKLAAGLGIPTAIRNFLYVVINRRRIRLLREIRLAFEAQLDQRTGLARAEVRSARDLSPDERASIEAALGRLSGKTISGHFSTDPELLGGVLARVGSTVYDGSVRGQLGTLRRRLVSDA